MFADDYPSEDETSDYEDYYEEGTFDYGRWILDLLVSGSALRRFAGPLVIDPDCLSEDALTNAERAEDLEEAATAALMELSALGGEEEKEQAAECLREATSLAGFLRWVATADECLSDTRHDLNPWARVMGGIAEHPHNEDGSFDFDAWMWGTLDLLDSGELSAQRAAFDIGSAWFCPDMVANVERAEAREDEMLSARMPEADGQCTVSWQMAEASRLALFLRWVITP